MTGQDGALAEARQRLARAQAALLAALVAGEPLPPGFHPARIRVQADALLAKRRETVARLRPDLVEAAGDQFRQLFDAYARDQRRPADGPHADAEGFARTLPAPAGSETSPSRALWGWLTKRRR